MTRSAMVLFLIVLCLGILIIHAVNLFALSIIYRLEIIEQDLAFLIRQQDVHFQNQGEIKDNIDQMLDIFAGATVDEFTVTAYAPMDPRAVEGMCYSDDPNVTASGLPPIPGETVAAGPGIPFGSRVWINGIGVRTVNDRGGRIHDRAIDIVVGNRAAAMEFGRQALKGLVVLP